MLYEAIGTIISATSDVQLQERYIHSLMEIPNDMVSQGNDGMAFLLNMTCRSSSR